MTPNELCEKAKKEHPLFGAHKWDHGPDWVGIYCGETWHWWVYVNSGYYENGLVCCREKAGTTPVKIGTLNDIEGALSVMAHKLLLGVWE